METKFTTANLYNKLDELNKIENEKIIKKEEKDINNKERKNLFINILKILFIISIVVIPLYTKYSDYTLQENWQHIVSYFTDFDANSKIVLSKDKGFLKEKDSIKQRKSPKIILTGSIMKDNNIYMVFNYQNMIITKTVGDYFDNGNYKIINIYGNNMDIADLEGNVYSYSLKQ